MSNICTVEFTNGVPRSYGVTIIEIGAKWYFKDITGNPNGRSDQASRRVQIEGGDADQLRSSTDECTYQVLCIMDIELSNGNTGRLTSTANSGVNKCLINVPMIVAPKLINIDKSSPLLEGSIDDVLSRIELNDQFLHMDYGELDQIVQIDK